MTIPSQSEMKVMQFPSKYVQDRNAIRLLPQYISAMGGKSLIVSTRSQYDRMVSVMGGRNGIEVFGGESSYEEIERVMGMAAGAGASVLVAVGGGKVIDVVKIAADRLGIPSIIVPTICATDAPCSGCAVTYSVQTICSSMVSGPRKTTTKAW